MPNHKQIALGLGALLVSFGLSACSQVQGERTVLESGSEKTTIIANTDAIKPQKGAAKIAQVMENFEGYGWFDKATIVGYQYASSVFGDDRGLVYKSTASQENKHFDGFVGKPELATLSLDGTKLALVKEGSGRKKPLYILDLVSGKTLKYDSGMLYTPWQFNWFTDGSGGALTPMDNEKNMLSLLDKSGRFTETLIGYTPKKQQGESYISLGTTLGRKDQDIYFLVYSDDSGIYRYNLDQKKSEQVLALDTVSQFATAPNQDYLALTSFKKSGSGSDLFIYNLKGEKVYELYKALNFNHLVWSSDGKSLAFEAIESSGESSLYLANMETGQTHFLGTYKGYSIKQAAFNPEGNQLMVTYTNQLTDTNRVDTQILWLDE